MEFTSSNWSFVHSLHSHHFIIQRIWYMWRSYTIFEGF